MYLSAISLIGEKSLLLFGWTNPNSSNTKKTKKQKSTLDKESLWVLVLIQTKADFPHTRRLCGQLPCFSLLLWMEIVSRLITIAKRRRLQRQPFLVLSFDLRYWCEPVRRGPTVMIPLCSVKCRKQTSDKHRNKTVTYPCLGNYKIINKCQMLGKEWCCFTV